MSETKAASAEKVFQSSKNVRYRYIENRGEKFVSKLQQFVLFIELS